MDLRSLKYFVATVDAGSINAAAVSCHVSQPSITMAIAKLEEELGCVLFRRHRKGCTPTPEGERMYEMASGLLNHAESIRREFGQQQSVQRLRLSIDPNIRINAVEDMLEAIKGAESDSASFQLELVSDERDADARLTTESQCQSGERFIALAREYYCLLIPHDNLLAYQPEISAKDLDGQGIIERIHCDKRQLFDQIVEQLGIQVDTLAKVESEEWAQALVGMGVGICFAPVPEGYSDPRFVVRSLESMGIGDGPSRQVGLAFAESRRSLMQQLGLLAVSQ